MQNEIPVAKWMQLIEMNVGTKIKEELQDKE